MSLSIVFERLHVVLIVHEFLVHCSELWLGLRLSDSLSNPVEEELGILIRIGNVTQHRDGYLDS